MGTEVAVEEKFIFGNVHPEDVVFTDLETGPESAKQAFKMLPGDVVDFAEFFDAKELRKSRSLRIAIQNGYIIPCETQDDKVEVPELVFQDGIAPLNEFDRRLAEELKKEAAELERLKAGRDGLAARVKDLDVT